jgi:hypothetical protein
MKIFGKPGLIVILVVIFAAAILSGCTRNANLPNTNVPQGTVNHPSGYTTPEPTPNTNHNPETNTATENLSGTITYVGNDKITIKTTDDRTVDFHVTTTDNIDNWHELAVGDRWRIFYTGNIDNDLKNLTINRIERIE